MDILIKQISKHFGTNQVIKNFDASFREGRINCLMGASGAGKTTVLNLLMGLLKPDSGEIQGMRGRRIAAVFQEDRLIEHWDAFQNVGLVCESGVTQEMIEKEFQRVGLEDYKNKPVSEFSGGMRRRVAIIRAMTAKSDLVIMDEPFKGLDEELKKQVIEYVKEKTKGKTVIIVTHDKEDIASLEADLVIM